ncbi:hypothetical protein HU200_010363 [Digitaria exilis]|uniref:RING-type E3 ubiquitin transferase n=1 Tax=Digitaria exilis TaxID=1010633 RepID=A0A835FJV1_9POAL|nr:hypothetical protein HU200_010363 [Digitaria exilis]
MPGRGLAFLGSAPRVSASSPTAGLNVHAAGIGQPTSQPPLSFQLFFKLLREPQPHGAESTWPPATTTPAPYRFPCPGASSSFSPIHGTWSGGTAKDRTGKKKVHTLARTMLLPWYGGFEEHEEDGPLSAFLCPITMEVMRDPVVIETGHAYERDAIARWFSECRDLGRGPCCPITMQEVCGADLRPVLALRLAIDEWADRLQRDELRRACQWLTKDATEKEAVWALGCAVRGWSGGRAARRVVRGEGMMQMVAGMLRSGSAMVRLNALEAIQEFAKETDQDREAVSQGDTIRTIVKFIDCEDCQERELAVSALCDLSKSEVVCGKISELNGAVLILGKVAGAITNLVQFVESDHQESRLASLKLIYKISFHMDHEIAQVFRASPTLLGCLVEVTFLNDGNTDEQHAALQILANLPKRDKHLTRELMEQGAFKIIARKVLSICWREVGSDIYDHTLLEGLVKVLARITYVLRDEPRCISLAREYNLAALFTSLLRFNGMDEVQLVSAKALMNLSLESKYLTSTPKFDEPEQKSRLALFGKKPPSFQFCRVHSGVCSIRDSFCILEGKAVERLVHCLYHGNKKVAEASLATLCTLLEDEVEIAEGVLVLHRASGIAAIFDILKENPSGSLQYRVTWAVERILRADEIAKATSTDRSLGSALVHAFQHGDSRTRRIAEAALKHVEKLPTFSQIIDKRPSLRGSSMGSMERFLKFDR